MAARRSIAPIVIVLVVLVFGSVARAETIFGGGLDAPFKVRAVQVSFDQKRNMYEARGQVEVYFGPNVLQADNARVFMSTNTIEADGNVALLSPGHRLYAEKIFVNTRTGVAKAFRGMIFLTESHFYVFGRQIEKTGYQTYRVRDGAVTSCDGCIPSARKRCTPDWRFTTREITVNVDGFGRATHATFRAGNVPLLYTPVFYFPAKTKRQSGFLMPMAIYSSRDGAVVSTPYYWNISNNQDLTFYPTYMSKRGVMLGLEYRYALSKESRGVFMVDYLFNDWGSRVLFANQQIAKDYADRFWFRAMGVHQLYTEVQLKYQLDLVSDVDFLREFGGLPSGYSHTHAMFKRMFNAEIEPKTSTQRTSYLAFSRTWDRASMSAEFKYYDNLYSTQDNKDTQQIMPYLSLDFARQPIGKSPMYFQLASSFTNYWRQVGSRGQVANITPTISLPLSYRSIVDFDTSLATQISWWNLSGLSDPNLSSTDHRELYTFQTGASTYIFRIFDIKAGSLEKIKHAIKPAITYTYQTMLTKNTAVPDLVGAANVANTITYSLTQTLTSKHMKWDAKTQKQTPQYDEFLKLTLSQSYDIRAATRQLAPNEQRRPFGNVTTSLTLFPSSKYLQLQASSGWNPYDSQWTEFNAELWLNSGVGDTLHLDYRHTTGAASELNTRLTWVILKKRLSFDYYSRHSFQFDRTFEATYQLTFTPQCWGIKLGYSEKPGDRTYYILFSLQGLGDVFGYSGSMTPKRETNPTAAAQ